VWWFRICPDLFENLQDVGTVRNERDEPHLSTTHGGRQYEERYRHSLGTGLLAQQLRALGAIGGNSVPSALAKVAGLLGNPQIRQRLCAALSAWMTLHHFNANTIGTEAAPYFQTPEELSLYLLRKALQSRVEAPPGLGQLSPGYMTRTVE
jgi:hypothetical protein